MIGWVYGHAAEVHDAPRVDRLGRRLQAVLVACLVGCAAPASDGRDADGGDDIDVAVDTDSDVIDTDDSDADTPDSGADTDDPGGDTASVPLPGLGTISGACGALQRQLLPAAGPGYARTAFDLGQPGWDAEDLTDDGETVATTENLGGNSLLSEGIAMEVLARCEGAQLIATEAGITYTGQGPRTDILVQVGSTRLGVSVVRAFQFPAGSQLSAARAREIVEDKLTDMTAADGLVAPGSAWARHALHVVAWNAQHADAIAGALDLLLSDALDADTDTPDLFSDHVVLVTVTDGSDGAIYGQASP